jgi:hypothetical protein
MNKSAFMTALVGVLCVHPGRPFAQGPEVPQDAASRPTDAASQPADAASRPKVDTAAAPEAAAPRGAADTNGAPSAQQENEPGLVEQIRDIAFYRHAPLGIEIRPIIRLAGGVNHQFRTNENATVGATAEQYDDRVTTTSILQFGLTGRLFKNLTFYSEFEKNMGAYGTSVWNGTAALQTRMNWLRYQYRDASVAAGVIIDPASVDFVSSHVLDMLGRDSNVANVPFYAGLNMGLGAMAHYRLFDLVTLGVVYSASNPLATSLSYGFGGKVSQLGNAYWLCTKNIAMGDPACNVQVQTVSPGFVLDLTLPKVAIELRGTAQFYFVNLDTNSDADVGITGRNFKGSLKVSLLDGMLEPFFNGNYRANEMLDQATTDVKVKSDEMFVGWTLSGGLDFNYWKRNGVGCYYGVVTEEAGSVLKQRTHYINVGTTFWLIDDLLAAGARYAKLITLTDGEQADGNMDYDSYFVTLRMVLN